MVHSIIGGNVLDLEGIDTLQAGHINGKLLGIRATLVVGVNAASVAEEMPGRVGIELIELQVIFSSQHF